MHVNKDLKKLHDLDNADPEKLTATERARLKKLKKLKKKKQAIEAAKAVKDVEEFHSTLQYPDDDEDADEGLDDEVERPRNVFGDDDAEDAEDDVPKSNVLHKKKKHKKVKHSNKKALTGADDEVDGSEHVRSNRTSSKMAASSTIGRSTQVSILAATNSKHKEADAFTGIPQANNVNGLLPPLSVPASVIKMLAQLTPKKPTVSVSSASTPISTGTTLAAESTQVLYQPTQSGGHASSAFATSTGAAKASATQTNATASTSSAASNIQGSGQSLGERMAAASFANLPPDERVAKLAASGLSNEQISLRTGLSLQQVMNARKKVATKSLIGDPRKLFADRLADFDEAFVEARRMYHDDPGSEIYYKAMNDFAKTMRELVKDYTDLEDPQEIALGVVSTSLRPFVLKVLKAVVDNMNAALKTVAPYLRDQERVLLADNIRVGMKTLQDNVNVEYNKAVSGLEQLYGVDLTAVKASSSKPPEIEGASTATNTTDTDNESKLDQQEQEVTK
jgi:hypothetical protein